MAFAEDDDYLTEGLTEKAALKADFAGEFPSIWKVEGQELVRPDDPFSEIRDRIEQHKDKESDIENELLEKARSVREKQDVLDTTTAKFATSGGGPRRYRFSPVDLQSVQSVYDPKTWTIDAIVSASKSYLDGVASDLGVDDIADDAAMDYLGDTLHEKQVPEAIIDQVQAKISGGKYKFSTRVFVGRRGQKIARVKHAAPAAAEPTQQVTTGPTAAPTQNQSNTPSILEDWFQTNPRKNSVLIYTDKGFYDINRPNAQGMSFITPITYVQKAGQPSTQPLNQFLQGVGNYHVTKQNKAAILHFLKKQAQEEAADAEDVADGLDDEIPSEQDLSVDEKLDVIMFELDDIADAVDATPGDESGFGQYMSDDDADIDDLAVVAGLVKESYIGRSGDKWIVYSKDGKKLGEHDTKESAENQLKAIETNKHAISEPVRDKPDYGEDEENKKKRKKESAFRGQDGQDHNSGEYVQITQGPAAGLAGVVTIITRTYIVVETGDGDEVTVNGVQGPRGQVIFPVTAEEAATNQEFQRSVAGSLKKIATTEWLLVLKQLADEINNKIDQQNTSHPLPMVGKEDDIVTFYWSDDVGDLFNVNLSLRTNGDTAEVLEGDETLPAGEMVNLDDVKQHIEFEMSRAFDEQDEPIEAKVAVTPPGHEKQVKKLKEDPDVKNPWAIAWGDYNKEHGKKPKKESAGKNKRQPSGAMSVEEGKKYGIPDYALQWSPGGSVPEGAYYHDGPKRPNGTLIPNEFYGQPNELRESLVIAPGVATKFHSMSSGPDESTDPTAEYEKLIKESTHTPLFDDLASALQEHAAEGSELRAEVRDEAVETLQMMDDFQRTAADSNLSLSEEEQNDPRRGEKCPRCGSSGLVPQRQGDGSWKEKCLDCGYLKTALIRISPPQVEGDTWHLERQFEYKAGDVVMSPQGIGEVQDLYDDGRTALVRLEPSGVLFPCQMNRLWKVVEATGKKIAAHEIYAELQKRAVTYEIAFPNAGDARRVHDEMEWGGDPAHANVSSTVLPGGKLRIEGPDHDTAAVAQQLRERFPQATVTSTGETLEQLFTDWGIVPPKEGAGKGPYPGGVMPPKWIPWSLREVWRAAVERYQDEGGELDDPDVYAGVVTWYKRLMEKYAPDSPISQPHEKAKEKEPWKNGPPSPSEVEMPDADEPVAASKRVTAADTEVLYDSGYDDESRDRMSDVHDKAWAILQAAERDLGGDAMADSNNMHDSEILSLSYKRDQEAQAQKWIAAVDALGIPRKTHTEITNQPILDEDEDFTGVVWELHPDDWQRDRGKSVTSRHEELDQADLFEEDMTNGDVMAVQLGISGEDFSGKAVK
jgi:hypothetical protein